MTFGIIGLFLAAIDAFGLAEPINQYLERMHNWARRRRSQDSWLDRWGFLFVMLGVFLFFNSLESGQGLGFISLLIAVVMVFLLVYLYALDTLAGFLLFWAGLLRLFPKGILSGLGVLIAAADVWTQYSKG